MYNGESDFVFGLKDCPMQGGRPICERCWNGAHCEGKANTCQCMCTDKPEPKPRCKRETKACLPLDDTPPIEV